MVENFVERVFEERIGKNGKNILDAYLFFSAWFQVSFLLGEERERERGTVICLPPRFLSRQISSISFSRRLVTSPKWVNQLKPRRCGQEGTLRTVAWQRIRAFAHDISRTRKPSRTNGLISPNDPIPTRMDPITCRFLPFPLPIFAINISLGWKRFLRSRVYNDTIQFRLRNDLLEKLLNFKDLLKRINWLNPFSFQNDDLSA